MNTRLTPEDWDSLDARLTAIEKRLVDSRGESKCYTMRGGIHIPGCMGCAAGGHDRCTCDFKGSVVDALNAKIAALEERIEALENPEPLNAADGSWQPWVLPGGRTG